MVLQADGDVKLNGRWGLVKDKRCQKCGGNLEVQIYPDGDKDVKCILCGRSVNNEVPDFILEEIRIDRGRSYVGIPRFKY